MTRTRMNRFIVRFTLLAFAALAFAAPAFAQASLTQTRLATRISSPSQTVITVSSGTGFAVGNLVYIDREAMLTRAVATATITVSRGYAGTAATEHVNGSIVWTGVAHYFYFGDPNPGACVPNQQAVLPYINVLTGNIWYCRNDWGAALGGKWQGINETPFFASLPVTHLALATTGSLTTTSYTARLDDVMIAFTTWTGAIELFLPGATGLIGKTYIIQDRAGISANAANTITIRHILNGGATSNTTIQTNYGTLRLISGITSLSAYYWFIW